MSEQKWLYDYFKDAAAETGSCRVSLAEYVRPFIERGEEITVSGHGTSMLPTIRDTDRLVVAPLPESIRTGDVLMYVRPDGHTVIHRVWRVHDGRFDMLGDYQLLIERNVPHAAVVALVKTVIHPDGRTSPGHQRVFRARVRRACRFAHALPRILYHRVFRR